MSDFFALDHEKWFYISRSRLEEWDRIVLISIIGLVFKCEIEDKKKSLFFLGLDAIPEFGGQKFSFRVDDLEEHMPWQENSPSAANSVIIQPGLGCYLKTYLLSQSGEKPLNCTNLI